MAYSVSLASLCSGVRILDVRAMSRWQQVALVVVGVVVLPVLWVLCWQIPRERPFLLGAQLDIENEISQCVKLLKVGPKGELLLAFKGDENLDHFGREFLQQRISQAVSEHGRFYIAGPCVCSSDCCGRIHQLDRVMGDLKELGFEVKAIPQLWWREDVASVPLSQPYPVARLLETFWSSSAPPIPTQFQCIQMVPSQFGGKLSS